MLKFHKQSDSLTVYNGFEDESGYKSFDGSSPLPELCGCCDDDDGCLSSSSSSCQFKTDSVIITDDNEKLFLFHRKLLLGEVIKSSEILSVVVGDVVVPNELLAVFITRDDDDDEEEESGEEGAGMKYVLEIAVEVLKNVKETGGFQVTRTTESDLKDVLIGVSLIRLFIQLNYTGPPPPPPNKELDLLLTSISELTKDAKVSSALQNYFEVDGFELDENVNLPVLLPLAKHFLSLSSSSSSTTTTTTLDNFNCRPFHLIWRFRLELLHQGMYHHQRSWTLSRNLKYFAESYLQWLDRGRHTLPGCLREVHSGFLCEISQMLSYYYDRILSKKFLDEAMKSLGLVIEFTGKHGYRTKFQQTPLPQIVASMTMVSNHHDDDDDDDSNNEDATITSPKGDLPESLSLNDETRLDRVRLVEDDEKEGVQKQQQQRGIHQLVLVGIMFHKHGLGETMDLDRKESEALINAVIDNPLTWSGRVSALVERCRFEKSDMRAVDRCLRQLDHLSTLVCKKNSTSSSKQEQFLFRQHLFFGSGHPTKSEIKILLGDVLLSMDHWKESLSIFTELHSFDKVVRCYQMMDLRHKAEELVLEKIKESGETPKLLCLLGDVTSEIANYEKAWTLSSGKSFESQMKLGNYHFRRQEYEECVVYFKRVVELAPLEYPSWIRLAWACYSTKDYETAYQAYLHAANLEYDNFQVWNNLANCALHLQRKDYALRAYKEAVKCSYDEWKVWNNILNVATELKCINDAIQAYHRILDLNKKFYDEEILSLLANMVIHAEGVEGKQRISLLGSVGKLLGRVTATGAKGYLVWLAYGRILTAYADCCDDDSGGGGSSSSSLDTKASNFERGLQFYDKSVTLIRQNPSWKSDLSLLRIVVDTIIEFRKKRNQGEDFLGKDAILRLKSVDFMLRQSANSVYDTIKKLVGEMISPNEGLNVIFNDICEEIKDSFYV